MSGDPAAPRRVAVQSIDRGVAILRCFDIRRPDLGISELATPIEQVPPQTITDPEVPAAQLTEVRGRGFARSTSDRVVPPVAVPIPVLVPVPVSKQDR
jgi:hypothetical protein